MLGWKGGVAPDADREIEAIGVEWEAHADMLYNIACACYVVRWQASSGGETACSSASYK